MSLHYQPRKTARQPVMVVCRSLDGVAGGIERMACELVNALVTRGRDVHLLTWDTGTPRPFYRLSPRVNWHWLDLGASNQRAGAVQRLRRARAIRRICRHVRPGVAICFQQSNFAFARLSACGLPIHFVAAERNAPTRFDHSSEGKRRQLVLQSLRLASRITVQFDNYIEQYPGFLRQKLVAIPNPVLPASRFASPGERCDGEKNVLLAVGRLSYQKNFEVLIEAFAQITDEYPHWRLDLVGDGEQEMRLRALVAARGQQGHVRFLGKQSDMGSLYARAQLFCLPSRWEGFPNALAEALASGLPSIGYAGCAGVNSLIRHEVNGLLASGNGDPEPLAQALARLMASPETRVAMGAEACNIVDSYVPAQIFDEWEALVDELCR